MRFLIMTRWGYSIRKDYPEYYKQLEQFDIGEQEVLKCESCGSKTATVITLDSLEDLLFVTEVVKGQVVFCSESGFINEGFIGPEEMKKYNIAGSIEIYDGYRE